MKQTLFLSIRRMSALVLLVGLLTGACTSLQTPFSVANNTDQYYQVDSTLVSDPDMTALIAPYLREMNLRMNTVIAWSETELVRGRPEGVLNNLSADIVRFRAVQELGRRVDIGVVNFGGLRAPLPQGNITVGNVYELMPFENSIAVLELDAAQVQTMANQLAVRGGEPVSGIRFRIDNGRAVDVLVGHEPLRNDRTYLVATNSYMADGGDGVPVFLQARSRTDLPVLIREAMIEYIRLRRHLNYQLEQRIRLTTTEE